MTILIIISCARELYELSKRCWTPGRVETATAVMRLGICWMYSTRSAVFPNPGYRWFIRFRWMIVII